jgi:hypothetical protein
MAEAMMPPFAPAESPPPVNDAAVVLVDVAEGAALAFELDIGAP